MRIDDKLNRVNIYLLFLCLMTALSACSPKAGQVKPEQPAKAISISSLEIGKVDDRSLITIKATESLQGSYTVIKLSDPPRVVVEMPKVDVGKFDGAIDVGNGAVAKVATSRLNGTGVRMEIVLTSLVEHEVKAEGNTIDIYFAKPQAPEAPGEKVEEKAKVEEAPLAKAEVKAEAAPPIEEKASAPSAVAEAKKEEKTEVSKKALKVTDVKIRKAGKFTIADIITDGEPSDYKVFDLKSPARVVVDLGNAREITAKKDIKAASPHIKGVRLGRSDGHVKVVFDYKGSVQPYEVVKGEDRISISFGKKPATAASKPEKAEAKEEVKIEEKAEVKEETKIETAPEAPKEEVKAEVKEETKIETRPEAPKEEVKAEEKKKVEETSQEKSPSPAAVVEPKVEVKAEAPQKTLKITGVKIKKAGKFTRADIIADGELSTYNVFELKSPDRVIVDIRNAREISAKKDVKAVSPHIKGARIGRYDGLVRVVFDYKGDIQPYEVVKGKDRISILFGKTPAAVVAKVEKVVSKEEAPQKEEAPKPEEKAEKAAEGAKVEAKPEVKEAAPVKEAKAEAKIEEKAEATLAGQPAAPLAEAKAAVETKPEALKQEEAKPEEKSEEKKETPTPDKAALPVAEAKAIVKTEEKKAVAPAVQSAPPVAEAKVVEEIKAASPKEGAGKVYGGQKVTLEFKDADIKNIFRVIAEISGYNMIIDNTVSGKVTLRLVNVPWDQALDLILETNGLGMTKVGNVIRVLPVALIRKDEQDKLEAKTVKEKQEDLVTKLIPVSYAKASDITSRIKGVMSTRGTADVDDRTNTIILKDIQKSIDAAEKLVASLDAPTPQVVIEARIVEANTNFTRDLGVQWGAGHTADAAHGNPTGYYFPNSYNISAGGGGSFALNPPATGGVGAGGGAGGVMGISFGSINNTLNLDLRLSALETQGWGKVISSPKIITLDNKEASIQQGIAIPFETTSASGTQTTFVDANLNLTVTPHVTADGRLSMKIKATKNAPSLAFKGASGAPSIDKKEASTEILVKDGDTTVIGGIYQITKAESESFTPFLGRIPIIGWLFKSKSVQDTKTELLIFITPRIVRDNPV